MHEKFVPNYFLGKNDPERFQGVIKDLGILIKNIENFVDSIKNKPCDWNLSESKIILYELYNVIKTIKKLSITKKFDDSLNSYNLTCISTLTRVVMDGFKQIFYLLMDLDKEHSILREKIYELRVHTKRLVLLQNGRLDKNYFYLVKIINDAKKDLLKNTLLLKLKGNLKNAEEFLDGNNERIIDDTVIFKGYNDIYIKWIGFHLSQFSHLTSLAMNQAKKDNQTIDQRYQITSNIISYNLTIFTEIIVLLNKFYNYKFGESYNRLTYYNNFIKWKNSLINRNFKDFLNDDEEVLFMKIISKYLNVPEKKFNNHNLFLYLMDHSFSLFDKNNKECFELRTLENGIYYLGKRGGPNEIKCVFVLEFKEGKIIKLNHSKDIFKKS